MIDVVNTLMLISLMCLLLGVGLRTPFGAVLAVARQYHLVLRGLVANFLIVPAVFALALQGLPLGPDIVIGLLVMAAVPVARFQGGLSRWAGHTWLGVLFLLLLGLPTASLGQDATERVFWRSVECDSRLQVEAYLEVYPAGTYVAEARACLERQLGLDRAARRLVQQGLAALDYAVGALDGLFGPATRAALRQWQVGKGFAATGYLTREQADALIAQGREAAAARPNTRAPQERKATGRIRGAPICTDQAEDAACWMELANEAGCYIWNPNPQKDESVTWTGECTEGLAHGEGSLTWVWGEDKQVSTSTGRLQDGKMHGHRVRALGGWDRRGRIICGGPASRLLGLALCERECPRRAGCGGPTPRPLGQPPGGRRGLGRDICERSVAGIGAPSSLKLNAMEHYQTRNDPILARFGRVWGQSERIGGETASRPKIVQPRG